LAQTAWTRPMAGLIAKIRKWLGIEKALTNLTP
jgi:hypothetical protein